MSSARTLQAVRRGGNLAHPPPSGPTLLLPRCLLVVFVLLLTACTDAPTATLDDPRAATSPAPGIAPAPDDGGPAPSAPGACDDELRTTLVGVVDGQLAAIAEQDWSGALRFATDGFRTGIDADRFRDIIVGEFPVVADNAARDVGRCRTRADDATLEVTVEDGDGTQQQLLYLFERGEDGWGIGGAAPAATPPPAGDEPGLTA